MSNGPDDRLTCGWRAAIAVVFGVGLGVPAASAQTANPDAPEQTTVTGFEPETRPEFPESRPDTDVPIGAEFAADVAEMPLQSSPDAGSYLAARAADRAHDFGAASEWFLRALADDPANTDLLEKCIAAMVGMGAYDRAQPLAARLSVAGTSSQLAHMVLMANAAVAGDWAAVRGGLDRGLEVSQLIDGLARAWSFVGDGRRADALAAFEVLLAHPETRPFGLYHKALALAVMGDLRGADAILSAAPDNGLPYTRRSIMAHAQVLSQLGEAERALTELSRFGPNVDPSVHTMRNALSAGETLELTLVSTAAEGLAEGYFNVARVLLDEAPDDYILHFIRMAERLHPDDAEITMMAAGLLVQLERYELAIAAYASIAPDSPAYASAEFGRADVLRRAGAPDEAASVLEAMIAAFPQMPMVHSELGDTLRALGRLAEARVAYGRALDLLPASDRRAWRVHFMRGISSYDLGDWATAESDLRAAYALNPDDAALLNFLGYSLVERGEHLDEALDLILRAVDAAPDSGAVLDSYGWALYQLGRTAEAVAPMEHAVRLEPESPVINDHLGDVYWTVGRLLEAHFQWRRALSFETDDSALAAIRAKLQHGLEIGHRAAESGAQDL